MSLLKWSLILAVCSIFAGIMGFTNASAGFADVARLLFYLFLIGFVVLLALGLTVFRRLT